MKKTIMFIVSLIASGMGSYSIGAMLMHAGEDKENFAISFLVAMGLEKLDIDRRDFIYMRSIKEERIKLMIEKHLAQECGSTMRAFVNFPVNNKRKHPGCQKAIRDIKTILDDAEAYPNCDEGALRILKNC